MFKKIKSLFSTSQAKQEASYFSPVEVTFYPLNNEDTYLENLTRRLPLAASCISLRARKVRTTPWRIIDNKGKEVKNHGIRAFEQPNSFQSFEDWLELMVWYLDSLGNAYSLKLEDGSLYLLKPKDVTIYTVEDLFITRYEYRTSSKILNVSPRDMIHLKYPNPAQPCYGMGLIQEAEILLQKNLNRDSFSSSFYKNGAVLSGIFSSDSTAINNETRERMKASFTNEMTGVSRFFKVFFAWAGMKFQPVSVNQRDAQDVEQYKMTRDDILAVFGVPGALLGFTDGVNFSNAEIQERVFINNTLIPLLQRLEQLITWELLRPYNSSWKFEFIKPVNENLVQKSLWVKDAFDRDIINKEEYSSLMGVAR